MNTDRQVDDRVGGKRPLEDATNRVEDTRHLNLEPLLLVEGTDLLVLYAHDRTIAVGDNPLTGSERSTQLRPLRARECRASNRLLAS